MSDAEPGPGLEKLREKVKQATDLIGQLRESNHSLTSDLAELRKQLKTASTEGSLFETSEDSEAADPADESASRDALEQELAMLRQERREIRAKVERLLQQIDNL